ncbi:MAG TPA: ATP synthase F0 subunit B [Candidatus Angelobacter sp.]|nr:ATP synthase F0 subunit B [Candidatus Angelobacter sp.]
MDEQTLRQLGELLLSSIPAIFGLLIVWAAYRRIVYTRLQQVLAERETLTEGAIRAARGEIAAAEERTADYERRVREARTQIFLAQEAHNQRTMEERSRALAEARKQAEGMVKTARASLEKDVEEAKTGLQEQADVLANRIIETVLGSAAGVGNQ